MASPLPPTPTMSITQFIPHGIRYPMWDMICYMRYDIPYGSLYLLGDMISHLEIYPIWAQPLARTLSQYAFGEYVVDPLAKPVSQDVFG